MDRVTKQANNPYQYKRKLTSFNRARDAWSSIIEKFIKQNTDATVILPAYIGWSKNEGSGIFDPVDNTNIPFAFYGLNKHLQIDFEDFKKKVKTNTNPIVLLVHYFGFPDSNYDEIANWLDEENVFYVEDSAHAMLTDLIGGICGRKAAYNLFALHKILPLETGGLLVDNLKQNLEIGRNPSSLTNTHSLEYDFKSIYDKRITNYKLLINHLKDINGITILYPELKEGVCPQTLPVLIHDTNRDAIYFEMNKRGFGFVSLYHTMIEQLENSTFESAIYTSKHILNLPVHQDCEEADLVDMIKNFKLVLNNG